MEQLIDAQRELHGRIKRSTENLRKVGAAKITESHVRSTLSLLENKWAKFESQHRKLLDEYRKDLATHEYLTGYYLDEVEATYLAQHGHLSELLRSFTANQPPADEPHPVKSESTSSRNTLPRIDIPHFSGKFQDWPGFRDLFQSMVIREPSLSKVEKLHYLRTSVDGDADRLIRNLPTTEENFERAWESVKSHYENKRLLVRAYLTTFTSLPPMKSDSVDDLRAIFHGVVTTVGALEGIGRPISNSMDLFVHLVVELLDPRTRLAWESSLGRSAVPPSYEELHDFLHEQLVTQEVFRITKPGVDSGKPAGKQIKHARSNVSRRSKVESRGHCPLCKGDHFVMTCEQYKQKSARERRDLANAHRLCWNCLGRHQVSDCPSTRNCGKCSARHNTTLHDAFATSSLAVAAAAPAAAVLVAGPPSVESAAVLLATARVFVSDRTGTRHPVRVLIDPGSETCMIAESLAQRLRLPRTPNSVAIFGIGGQQTGVSRGRIALSLVSRTGKATLEISALVFPRLTIYGTSVDRGSRAWPHLDGLELADPEFCSQDSVELLLGADAYAHIALSGLQKGGPQEPIAQNTSFGWVILGTAGASRAVSAVSSMQCSSLDELTALVRQFWEQEEPPRPAVPLTAEEQKCEEHFERTHSRVPGGRYRVRLPVRDSLPDLTASRLPALRMLSVMELRFERDAILRDRYHDFLREYVALGHMSPASPLLAPRPSVCYLPHHGVWKGEGDSAKIRVVFNGSARVRPGTSLNECLFPGPNLLPSLADVLTRWRRHRFVVASDIEKMYRQILVHPEDRDLQRILWKENNLLTEFQLNTVTYGLSSAPYLAIRVLRQLAADEGSTFPRAAEALRHDAYMDDILAGAANLADARRLRRELTSLCTAGGFPLRKWTANCAALLEDVPAEHRSPRAADDFLPVAEHSVLGLRWNPESDCFSLIVRPPPAVAPTKRSLLSASARLFDPLGWLAPVTVLAKLLIQTTWLQQLDWDAPLAATEAAAWSRLEAELHDLEALRVPRWFRGDDPTVRIELHGFSDASERAYAAVVYLRSSSDGETSVSLVSAKTRVAPLRRVSLPRLELCGAALLAGLVDHVRSTLDLSDVPVHLWTDSTVTLGWIRGHPARWTTYVANRVAEIQRSVPTARWHHLPGRINPADCASRGMPPRELLSHTLWWDGPDFLRRDASLWPGESEPLDPSDLPERRPLPCLATSRAPEPEELTRFSSLRRLLRVTAWMRRWSRLSVTGAAESPVGSASLDVEELRLALECWLRVVQGGAFPLELTAIAAGRALHAGSSLRRLGPMVDSRGILRVSGRLKHSLLDVEQRHPAILPPESHLTLLVVGDNHRRTLHGGTQATLAAIRQRYWIPRGRQLVRRYIHRCTRCARWRAATPQPMMGSLPRARVTPGRPFLCTGVDFAGPVLLRTSRGRGHKAYKAFLAVFVCFSSRAIYLEVVSDYTADAFLAAFRRFVSRRGLCRAVYSDCGTNFVGADSQLRALFEPASREVHRILGSLGTDGIQWHFNPPAAPHFGGLWEAGVKSVKHHLRRVIGETKLTFEEMSTFLAEVEACLNSRPLQALTDDPDDLGALTPGHFLVGGPLNAIPEPALTEVPTNRLSRWRLLQAMRDHLWQRWTQEYLQELTPRPKWWRTTPNLKEGQLCLLRNETTPPTRWPLARIVRLYPGDDGQIRVVEVRTPAGTLTRPAVKIVPLPAADADAAPE
ncbi:uncharacterized protein LOC118647026 [Monomorium pharaonis]|uniref:uncharacterized protein LOC118647026 n=1 Tax=Monomorium pharaonis TaxID=307658 RepID=UPI0017476474|nr:uncharacterized protein LOC118647026 [Monomorium pharaonis]